MNAIPLVEDQVYYPDSDGEPVAETPVHFEEMVYVWEALGDLFEDDPDVFVGANMFLYYRKGDPKGVVAPDGFVVKGVPKIPGGVQRRKYLPWEEGQVPCFVLETTSESTHAQDKNKRRIYAQLGVAEYFQFDPFGEYLRPPLQGLRLVKGHYEPVRPNADGSLLSETLGVVFRADGIRLRLTDAVTGVPFLRAKEIQQARRQAARALEVRRWIYLRYSSATSSKTMQSTKTSATFLRGLGLPTIEFHHDLELSSPRSCARAQQPASAASSSAQLGAWGRNGAGRSSVPSGVLVSRS